MYNLSYYSNPALDRQISNAESLLAMNPAAGSQLYRSMQAEILKQAPIAFLYDVNNQYAMTTTFSSFQMNPAYANVVFVYNLRP